MATITYKYIPLGDPDVANNQSRGISYQFNGYAPVTFSSNVSEYLDDLGEDDNIPDFISLLKDCGGVVLFKDLSYVASGGKPVSNSSNYKAALSSPGSHMFTDLNVEAADEFQMKSEVEKVPHSSTVVEIPISDTMMGNNLSGKVRVDAIVIYGQAYNIDFYSEVQQGTIERAVAIGLVIFGDDNKPEIDPDSGSKSKTAIRITLGISSAAIPDEFVQSESFNTWKKFAGSMHVVNNDLLTNSAFCIRGNDVEPIEQYNADGIYAEQLQGGDVVDVNSRMFFTNDVGDGTNWDHNVDFGSPAKLTVLNRSEPITDDTRLPQTVIGKVKYTTDENGYKHACLEGVHQSFFECSASTEQVGSVFEKDWFAKEKPALNIFSEANGYLLSNTEYADYLKEPGDKRQSDIDYDLDNYEASKNLFANGNQLFSRESLSCGNGTNISTSDCVSRGNSLIVNSRSVKSFSKAYTEDDLRSDPRAVMYDTFVANADNVTIYNRVKGSSDPVWGNYTTRAMNSVINSKNIKLDNRNSSDAEFGSVEYGRNFVAGSCNLEITNSDMNMFLGVKGIKIPDFYSEVKASVIKEVKDSIFIGGAIKAERSKKNIVLGMDYVISGNAESSEVRYNTIESYITPTGNRTSISNSLIIGSNCHLSTHYVSPISSASDVYDSDSSIFLIGKGLKNDVRQSYNDYTEGLHGPTIVAGWNNQYYYQNGFRKMFVLGGGKHRTSSIPDFKYNSFEIGVRDATLYTQEVDSAGNRYDVWNTETIMSLTDIKGRSVDYGSDGIKLGFLKGRRHDANYGRYKFFSCGRINLYKLYALLQRIKWIPQSVDPNDKYSGFLVFDSSMAGGDSIDGSMDSLYRYRSIPWSSYSKNAGSTCLADLVDDDYCYYKYYPQKPENY